MKTHPGLMKTILDAWGSIETILYQWEPGCLGINGTILDAWESMDAWKLNGYLGINECLRIKWILKK
jgi:hypothetical protein